MNKKVVGAVFAVSVLLIKKHYEHEMIEVVGTMIIELIKTVKA